MSDSLIAFQPAIDEPSNGTPSLRKSSLIVRTWWARCCHLPRGSVKRKSTYLTSCSWIMSRTFWVSAIVLFRCWLNSEATLKSRPARARRYGCGSPRRSSRRRSCRRRSGRYGPPADRLDGALDHRILHDDLDFHLRQKIDDVFGAAIKLGMALLPAEALGLGDGDALDPDLVKRLLHLVELERLDDGLDLLHRNSSLLPGTPPRIGR